MPAPEYAGHRYAHEQAVVDRTRVWDRLEKFGVSRQAGFGKTQAGALQPRPRAEGRCPRYNPDVPARSMMCQDETG